MSCGETCCPTRGARDKENLEQKLWVDQSQDFTQVWLNLREKIAREESQSDGEVRKRAPGIDCAKIR